MEWLLVLLLGWMLLAGTLASGWNDANDQWSRMTWIMLGCGGLLAWHLPNPWLGGLLLLFLWGTLATFPMSQTVRHTVLPTLVLAGAYLVAVPLIRPWMVAPVLAAMVGVGLLLSLYAWSVGRFPAGPLSRIVWGSYPLLERDTRYPLAGQGNWNHAQAIGALAVAANVGLILVGDVWTALLLPLSALSVVLCIPHDRFWPQGFTTQGAVHLGTVGVATTGLLLGGWQEWGVWGAYVAVLVAVGQPWKMALGRMDSGRLWSWRLGLKEIWWAAYTRADAERSRVQSAAHVESLWAFGQRLNDEQEAILAGTTPLPPDCTLPDYQRVWHVTFQQWLRTYGLAQQASAYWTATVESHTLGVQTWTQRWPRLRLSAHKWTIRLLGLGTHTWFRWTRDPTLAHTAVLTDDGTRQGIVFLSAHNEYVEWVFEHGLVGGVVLGGFLWTTVSPLWASPGPGHAVYLLAVTLCSIAMMSFPWTLFQEVPDVPAHDEMQYIGAPGLLVWSLVIALLAGGLS
jgi:hypothetical protein